jgi:PAS domain S-box-containing protein
MGGSESTKLQELHKTRKAVSYEKKYIRKDGSRIPVELVVHPRFDKDGNVGCYLVNLLINCLQYNSEHQKNQES